MPHNNEGLRRRFWPLLVAALVAAAFAQACTSDSDKDATPQTAQTPERTASGEATPASPVPAGTPAPLDPGSISYQQDTGPNNNYRIDIPAGWTQEGIVAPGTGRRYVLTSDGVRTAAISVSCAASQSIDDMMSVDNLAIGGRNGQFPIGPAIPMTIGGLSGRMVDFFVSPAGTPVEGRTIYLTSARCGWRLSLQAFSAGGRERFAKLFERVAQSFQELPAGGPG